MRQAFVDCHQPIFKECLRVLKPGAHGVVWALPRTAHWTATALEDAGFELRDCGAFLHVFGSGFPKSRNPKGDWTGWGTALKPALEHWILVRKAPESTIEAQLHRTGTGVLNIDGCRVPSTDGSDVSPRWPPNLLLHHGEHCTEECCEPGCPVRLMDEQSGAVGQLVNLTGNEPRSDGFSGPVYGSGITPRAYKKRGDKGGASKFFPRFRYQAKPPKSEKEAGLAGVVEPRQQDKSRKAGKPGGDNPRNRGVKPRLNHHPTVKSVELMRWLVRLVGVKGRAIVLDPFAGSGTTGVAAILEGKRFIGIERDAEEGYYTILKARVKHAIQQAAEKSHDAS